MILSSDFMYRSDHNGDIKFFTIKQNIKTKKAEVVDLIDIEEVNNIKDDIEPRILLDLICAIIDEVKYEDFDLRQYIKYFNSDFHFTPIQAEKELNSYER